MAQTRAYLRAFLLMHADLREIVLLLNRALSCDIPDGHFTTLLFARLDPNARSVRYVSAGHTTGYLFDAAGAVKARIESTGMPLGVLADGDFEASPPLGLEPGDLLLFMTDGVVEAYDHRERVFGVDRTLDAVRANRWRPAREVVARLFQEVRDFCGERAQLDDMTAVVIKLG
jgi:sigma-B regulation protein RsbU (phosphoserine phosphatase)